MHFITILYDIEKIFAIDNAQVKDNTLGEV
jgi:hypothetical protein